MIHRPPGLVEYATNKPLPPPKAPQSYKPVPPPKPKNYRPPTQHAQQASQPYFQHATIKEMNGYQHAKSYSMADTTSNNYSAHLTNGVSWFLARTFLRLPTSIGFVAVL